METETTITVIANRVGELEPDMGLDAFLEARSKIDFIKERIREVDAEWTDRMIELVEINGGRMTAGPKTYYVGDEKKEKNNDVRKTAEEVLTVSGGDLDLFCTTLSTNAFKPGATKKLLGDEKFKECFTVTYEKKLKSDGTAQKQLHVIDERFLR